MKKLLFLSSLIVILTSFAFGQKDSSSSLSAGASLEAQLQQTLDVKNAKVGDKVVLAVTKAVKQNGETIVPKGAKLIGRVTEVQEKTKSNAASKLGVVFDRIEGKNLNSPISATITSITSVASRASVNNDVFESDTSASSNTSATVSRRNQSGNNGGGLLGGVGNTVGGAVNTTTDTVGGVTNTVGNTVGSTTKTVGKTVSGISISQSAEASASGSTTLSTQNKNLKVEKGATFRLFVSEAVEK